MSLNDGFQQSNFRQVGGYEHGGFKYLTEEQFNELKDDPLIKEWGVRRVAGLPRKAPFDKTHVEIGYADANYTRWTFCDPVEGRLSLEGTDEAAASLRVLELLGVEPVLGNTFAITFEVANVETTQTFTLCGWWEYDEVTPGHHVLIPESRLNAILAETGVTPFEHDDLTGTWLLDVMLGSTLHIEWDIITSAIKDPLKKGQYRRSRGEEEKNRPIFGRFSGQVFGCASLFAALCLKRT